MELGDDAGVACLARRLADRHLGDVGANRDRS
jgi:hypothetical protein